MGNVFLPVCVSSQFESVRIGTWDLESHYITDAVVPKQIKINAEYALM